MINYILPSTSKKETDDSHKSLHLVNIIPNGIILTKCKYVYTSFVEKKNLRNMPSFFIISCRYLILMIDRIFC